MAGLHFSVRSRLLGLIVALLMLFGGADVVLTTLIANIRSGQQALQEEYRRFEVIQAVQQAIIEDRHAGSQVNSAIMVGDTDKQAAAEKDQATAKTAMEAQLARLKAFDDVSFTAITDALSGVDENAMIAIRLLAAHKEREAAPIVSDLDRRMAFVQSTLDHVAAREREQSKAELAAAEHRTQLAEVVALVLICAAFAIGIPLALIIGRSIAGPLAGISHAIRRFNEGDFSIELPPVTPDEFGEVSNTLRQMREGAEKLRQIAFYDPMTGLGNRNSLEKRLEDLVIEARQAGTGLAAILCDLDNFRSINDRYGYRIGDTYLVEAASRLRRLIPDKAELFRYSGDKFVCVTRIGVDAGAANLKGLTDKILRGMSAPHVLGSALLNMSASIGVSTYPEDGETATHIIGSAESANQAAKKSGRNTARFAGGTFSAQMRSQMALAGEVRLGLQRQEFELFYQPIVDGDSQCAVAAEALVRWHHPERGLLGPDQFIGPAEEAGLMVDLGEACVRMAHAQAARWLEKGLDLRIAVNLSARQIQEDRILEPLKQLRAENPKAASMIDLELTESVIFERSEAVRATLDQIKKLGYRLGLDDFGTGYSSLRYLQWLPIDKIKIDRQFVEHMSLSAESAAIVSAVLALARSLRLEVVAEGVETQDQIASLLKQGCILFQGFFFSPALPPQDFERWVAEYQTRHHAGLGPLGPGNGHSR